MSILSKNDGTLDAFVLGACEARGIECDGDLWGILFCEKDEFTLDEAQTIMLSQWNHETYTFDTLSDREGNSMYRVKISRNNEIIAADSFYTELERQEWLDLRFPNANEE